MTRTVLVAYATKKGSTREVAEAIAATLRAHELEVDVAAAGDAHDLHRYSAIVLGGAIYLGRWHQDARRFLARHRADLAMVPFVVFGMGPRTLSEKDVNESRAQLERALGHFPDLHPLSVAIFGGVLDPAKLSFPLNRMEAVDARDWDAIEAWAVEVATTLTALALA